MNITDLKSLYKKFGGDWGEVNIFGIRNEYDDKSDLFNDQIGIATDDVLMLFSGTTDPGLWWTSHPASYQGVTGAAHLVEGFHPHIWRVGTHASGTPFAHQALIQTGNKVKFWRDVDKDQIRDSADPVQEGYVGINLHRAGMNDPRTIGRYSAGCQVVMKHMEFASLLSVVLKSDAYRKEREFARFSYLLMNIKNIKE